MCARPSHCETERASALLRLEAALEVRQRAAWAGMLLYVVSAVYVCYLAVKGGLGVATWNALFWIILLFAGRNHHCSDQQQ
ncbi:MAG: hypothetical protein IPN30_11725 [Flavobacteriales bacterium]|nr:hypothetical protein [Flavobacteriales bacterium]